MDLLKRELERKRKILQEDFGDKKMMKRSEIEKKNIQKLRLQEHLEIQSKSSQKQNPNSSSSPFNSSSSSTSSTNPNSSSSDKTDNSNKSSNLSSSIKPDSSNEQKIEELVLPRQEVIRRLRFFKQPITLFGEDDDARLDRLKLLLKAGILDTVDNDMTEGQTNDFLRDMSELRKRQKTGHLQHRKKKEMGGDGEEGCGAGDEDPDGDGGLSTADADKDLKRMKSKFEDLCQEDKILVFFKRLLNEWGQELQEMTDTERRTAKGKAMVATHKQCARYLNPLFKFCRKKVLPDDIRQALMVVVGCCIKRDYLAAMDQYIKLAIGNAPWPIGVTMVGIHERSAREKIYTNSVAHIMNDETTRKYLQSVKRLMTFCQRRYPSMPSKAVEFNSLANGSDLQSLLSEERANSSDKLQEDRLMLMPMPAAPSSN